MKVSEHEAQRRMSNGEGKGKSWKVWQKHEEERGEGEYGGRVQGAALKQPFVV